MDPKARPSRRHLTIAMLLRLTVYTLGILWGSAKAQTPSPAQVCPFTKAPPTKPTVPFTRCLDANSASCCSACSDIKMALNAVTTTMASVLGNISSTVSALTNPGNQMICQTFVGHEECENQIEQLICALNCNPWSPLYVIPTGTGSYNFAVCQQQAQAVYDACKDLSVPGRLFGSFSLGTVARDPQSLLSNLFQGFGPSLFPGVSITMQVVDGNVQACYSGPTTIPSRPGCCDPLGVPAGCPTGAVDLASNPQWAATSGNLTDASVCRAAGQVPPSPVIVPPPPPLAPATLSTPAAPATPATAPPSTPGAPATPATAPPAPLMPPGVGIPGTASPSPASGNFVACPFTKALPTVSAVPFTRCVDASEASCCTACADIKVALTAAATKLADILSKISSSISSFINVGDETACNLFAGNEQCETLIEQLICAVNCNPLSGYFVTPAGANNSYNFAVCQPVAQSVYDACKGLKVQAKVLGQISLGSVVSQPQQLLSYLFTGFSATVLPGTNITVQVVDPQVANCYGGPVTLPPKTACCDPLGVPAGCPAGAVDLASNPQWAATSGNLTDASVCRAPGQVPPSPVLPLPPVSSSSPPPTAAPSSPAGVVPLSSPPIATAPPGSYPACPFSGKLPAAPTVASSRCPAAATATCCDACTDLSSALGAVSSTVADIVCKVLPAQVCALFPPATGNAQLCTLLAGDPQCSDALEQLACAVTCNPDSGSFVASGTSGYTFSVCSSFADSVYSACGNISLPGISGTLGSLLGETNFVPTLFYGVSQAILTQYPPVSTTVVNGTAQCFNGNTPVPAQPFCCDPLTVPSQCPPASVNLTAHPSWAFNSGNVAAAAVCRAPGTPSSPVTPATPSTPFIPSTPSTPSTPPTPFSPFAPSAPSTFSPSVPATPGSAPSPLMGAGLCPLTGKAPQKPSIPHTRCVAANSMSCCEDCADITYGLAGVSANVSSIICQLLPGACKLFQGQNGDVQLCSVFVNFQPCEIILEEMVCAVSCNPDSGTYVAPGADGYTFSVCSAYAQRAYSACQDLRIPGFTGTLGSVLPDAQTFLSTLFKGIAKLLNQYTFTTNVVNATSGCFGGAQQVPPKAVCCDPLAVPSTCPPGAVNTTAHPNWVAVSNRPLNPQICNQPVDMGPNGASDLATPPSSAPPGSNSGSRIRASTALSWTVAAVSLLFSLTQTGGSRRRSLPRHLG